MQPPTQFNTHICSTSPPTHTYTHISEHKNYVNHLCSNANVSHLAMTGVIFGLVGCYGINVVYFGKIMLKDVGEKQV